MQEFIIKIWKEGAISSMTPPYKIIKTHFQNIKTAIVIANMKRKWGEITMVDLH